MRRCAQAWNFYHFFNNPESLSDLSNRGEKSGRRNEPLSHWRSRLAFSQTDS